MTLPNFLSLFRLISSPAILWALYKNYIQLASVILVLACITDILDGYIARKWNLESALGKYLDPLADKTLMLSLLLGLYYFDKLHSWLVILALIRDLSIMGGILSLWLQSKDFAMRPLLSSKISTTLQMLLCCIIVFNWGFELGISSQIIYDAEGIVSISIIYSFIQYTVIWWNIQTKKQ